MTIILIIMFIIVIVTVAVINIVCNLLEEKSNKKIDSPIPPKEEDLTGQAYRNIRSQALIKVICDNTSWGRYVIEYEYDNVPGVKFKKLRNTFLSLFEKVQ